MPRKQEAARTWAKVLSRMHSEGVGYAQIAEMSGVPLTTVKDIAAGDRCYLHDATAIMLQNAIPRFELAVRLRRSTKSFQEAMGA